MADEDHHLHLRPMHAVNRGRSVALDRGSRTGPADLADSSRDWPPVIGSLRGLHGRPEYVDRFTYCREPGRTEVMSDRKGRSKPGQSGNPGGRPPGTSLTAKIRKALETPDESDPSKTVADSIIEAMIREARGGDVQAFRTLIERVDGKVAERLEMASVGPPLIHTIEVVIPKAKAGNREDS